MLGERERKKKSLKLYLFKERNPSYVLFCCFGFFCFFLNEDKTALSSCIQMGKHLTY